MDYKVSVIIPVYNAEKTLERAFLSVKNQTIGFENIELLLCDDCSTDGSYALIQKWAAEYPNVKAFRTEKNSGAAGAPRNICLDNVKADYVMFLDADDAFTDEACQALLYEIERSNVDIVSGYYCYARQSGKRVKKVKRKEVSYATEIDGKTYDIKTSFESFFPLCAGFWCKIYKSSIINENAVRFLEGCMGEDVYFLVKYMLHCNKAKYIKSKIYDYYKDKDSLQNYNKLYFIEMTKHYYALYELMDSADKLCYFPHFFYMDYYLREYSLTKGFSEEDTAEVLKAWWKLGKYAAKIQLPCTSPQVKTFIRDAANDDFNGAVFHMEQFRELEADHKRQMDSIITSRGWRIITRINKFLGRV